MTAYFAVLCATWLVVVSTYVWTSKFNVWNRDQTNAQLATYVTAVALQHVSIVAQGTFLWLCLSPFVLPLIAQVAWTGIFAALVSYTVIDATLFVHGGLRLRLQLLKFVRELRGLASNLPVTRLLVQTVVGCLVAAGSGAWCIHVALRQVPAASYASILRQQAAAAVVALLAFAAARLLHERLSRSLSVGWDNCLFSIESVVLTRAWMRVTRFNKPPPRHFWETVNERSTPANATYPLLRKTHGFTGAKTFQFNVPKGKKPHVVVMFLETFRAANVGILNARYPVTPNYDALTRESVHWTNFYANGTLTSRAMVSALYGILPSLNEFSTQSLERPPHLIGLPHIFREQGYHSAYFCDGPMNYENKRSFFMRNGFSSFYGAPSIRAAFPHLPVTDEWQFPDEWLMRYHVDWLAVQQQRNTPTFSSMLTISNHYPWHTPANFAPPNVDVNPESLYHRFLHTMHYTDHCLGLYVRLLKERGLDDNVVLIVMGDHGAQFDESTGAELNWHEEFRDQYNHIPMLIWSPKYLQPAVIDEVASQVDIVPTLLDMFNMESEHHAMGSSLMRACSTRQAMGAHLWNPGFYASRSGAMRHVYRFADNKVYLFDLNRDPLEQFDLRAMLPDVANHLTEQAFGNAEWMKVLHGENRYAPAPTLGPVVRLTDDYPTTLQHCLNRQARADALLRAGHRDPLLFMEAFWLGNLLRHNAPESDLLLHTQVLYKAGHLAQLGEMSDAEAVMINQIQQGARKVAESLLAAKSATEEVV